MKKNHKWTLCVCMKIPEHLQKHEREEDVEWEILFERKSIM